MNRRSANTKKLLILALAVVLFLMGCDMLEESPTPIFAETKFMEAYNSEDCFHFSPSSDVEYIVLGIFNSPIVTSGKSIVNMVDMMGGSCTGQLNFTRSQVPEDSLFTYSHDLKFFTGLPGDYVPNGTKHWAVWGFNADWVIISSSNDITTDFL
jgi:hypothetical protein